MNCAASCQGDYLYTVLIVSFNESVLSATRIVNLYSFSSCVTGVAVGFVVLKVRRLKPFILFGTCLHLVAYGLLIKYRGGLGANHSGMVGAQILMGIAVGFFTYAALASVQSATRHEHVAVITGLYFCCFSVGGAVGNAISGAIWTQILPGQLQQALSGLANSATLADNIYAAPFTAIEDYPWGTPVRDGIVEAYRHTQKLLCITGICIAVLCLLLAVVLRDIHLTNQQSREEVKNEAVTAKRTASES